MNGKASLHMHLNFKAKKLTSVRNNMKPNRLFPLLLFLMLHAYNSLHPQVREDLIPSSETKEYSKAEMFGNLSEYNQIPSGKKLLKEADANEFWSGDFGLPGTDQYSETGHVLSIESAGEDIYIGGMFRYAQDSLVNSIAKFDGSKFCSVGGGVNGYIWTIKPAGSNIYVGGFFSMAGTVPANNIAMWDGSSWHALAEGICGGVFSIEIIGSNIYAGGEFDTAGVSPANNIAVWNGAAWSSLGDGTNGIVKALKAVDGDLYIGGHFISAGGITVNNITKWNGVGYDALDSGTEDVVNTIEADGSVIYAGGEFLHAGGITVNNIAKWENNIWSKVGSGVNGPVNDILVHKRSIYIGGRFEYAGILTANGIARWNGLLWDTVGSGMNLSFMRIPGVVVAMSIIDDYLYVGGAFDRAGNVSTNNLAYWDGGQWKGVGPIPVIGGADFMVNKVVMQNSELYAVGRFCRIGNTAAGCIAKWNGSQWVEIGGGVNSFADPASVEAICFAGTDLYIGGFFTTAGSISVNNIAKWNGSEWSPLGKGLKGPVSDIKYVGGILYAAGRFDSAGTVAAKNVARWNGSDWSALGNGLSGKVYSILPVGSDLYAAGYFTLSGTDTVNNIAKWNGFTWSDVGNGFNNGCVILYSENGLLYAGGSFTEAGGIPADYVAVWNGSSWSSLGTGLSYSESGGGVGGLIMADGKLYASGLFDQAGILTANSVAVYDGVSWQPLGDGLGNFAPYCVSSTLDYSGPSDYDIYFGGMFSSAGGKPSYNIAKYSVMAVDVNYGEFSVPKDFFLKQNYPNPFNPATSIEYRVGSLPAGKAGLETVILKIFDVLGNEVAVIVNEAKPAGEYKIQFDAKSLSSGVYFYQMKAGRFLETRKMILLK
jgi:hypothetical protein